MDASDFVADALGNAASSDSAREEVIVGVLAIAEDASGSVGGGLLIEHA